MKPFLLAKMHYYKRNLGDYAKKAGRLSMLQHGSYTLLIDACYDREQFPTLEQALEWTWASTTDEKEAVIFVLHKFFMLEDGVFVQKRIREELIAYHDKSDKNTRIAIDRETKRKETSTKRAPCVNASPPQEHEPPPNHKPLTNNQEPITKNTVGSAKRRTRLSSDFYPNETGVTAVAPITITQSSSNQIPNTKDKSLAPLVLPDWIPSESWNAFLQTRKKKRAADTPFAVSLILKDLIKFRAGGHDIEDILNKSIKNGWTDVYEPKAPSKQFSGKPAESFAERDERHARERYEEATGKRSRTVIDITPSTELLERLQ